VLSAWLSASSALKSETSGSGGSSKSTWSEGSLPREATTFMPRPPPQWDLARKRARVEEALQQFNRVCAPCRDVKVSSACLLSRCWSLHLFVQSVPQYQSSKTPTLPVLPLMPPTPQIPTGSMFGLPLPKVRSRGTEALLLNRLLIHFAFCLSFPHVRMSVPSRCFRLSLPCFPQPPRLPPPSTGKRSRSAPSTTIAVVPHRSSNSIRHASPTVALLAEVGEKEEGMDEQRTTRILQTSLIDFAFARSDPRRLTTSYLAGFVKMRQEVGDDGVDRTRVIQLIRAWRRWSAVAGADVSWGLGNQIMKLMRIVPLDLENAASISLGPARARRKAKAQEELVAMTTLADEVRASEEYRALAQAQDEATPMYVGVLDGDVVVQMTNAAFDRLLGGSGEMGSRVLVHRMMPMLLLGQLVAPDDREAFYEGFMCFFVPSRRKKNASFLKWFAGDGEIRLCIVSFRSVLIGHRHGIQLLVETAPDSRYLTTQPHRNQIIDIFRARSPSSSPSTSPSIGLNRPSSSLSLSMASSPPPLLTMARGRQMGEAWGESAGRSQQGSWRMATNVTGVGSEAETGTVEGGGGRGGGGGGGGGGVREGEGMTASAFSFPGLACLFVADALPTGEGQREGLNEKRECLFTTGLGPGNLLRGSSQDWRYGKGASGKLGRMERLRRRRQEEGGFGGSGISSSSSGSSESSGMREGGDAELVAVLASALGPGLDDEEMSRVFE